MSLRSTPGFGQDPAHLRALLVSAGYDEPAIRHRLAISERAPLPPVGHALSLARLAIASPDALSTLIRLLLLGKPVHAAEPQLSGELVNLLTRTNLVECSGDTLWPMTRLTPYGDLLLVSDLHNEDSSEVALDAVEQPHGPTDILARLIPRGSVRRSLDIGTGSGVHALGLANHSDSVLGVDISTRALAFAQFNAALNDTGNVRFDMADVVNGLSNEASFDLITSNPPYLISPETDLVYRDGPPESPHVGTRVLTEAPSLLSRQGLLVCLTSWVVTDTDDPTREIEDIARRVRCDAVTFVYAVRTATDDALRWNTHRQEAHEAERAATRWADFYQQHGIDELAYGIVVFRRTRGHQPWFHWERVSLRNQQDDRGQLSDILSALDNIHAGQVPDTLEPHPEHELEFIGTIRDGNLTVRDQFLCSTRGIRLAVECGPRLLNSLTGETKKSGSGSDMEAITSMRQRLYELGLVIGSSDE